MKELLTKYLSNQCTPEEMHQLLDFFGIEDNEAELREAISKYLLQNEDNAAENDPAILSAVEQVYQRMTQDRQSQSLPVPAKLVSVRKKLAYGWAAVFIFLIGTGVYFVT